MWNHLKNTSNSQLKAAKEKMMSCGGECADSWKEQCRIVNNDERKNKYNGESAVGEKMREELSWKDMKLSIYMKK